MPGTSRALWRRLSRVAAGCLLSGALVAPPLGPTTTRQAVDQINAGSMRPTPSAPPRPVVRDSMIWVPAREVPLPGQPGTVLVPGHWERRLPGTSDVHVPPLTVFPPPAGAPQTIPAGVRPPVEQRSDSP